MPTESVAFAAVKMTQAAARTKPSNYPEPFASMMSGRIKRPLGDLFGLRNFGVNHVTLPPATLSALFHSHAVQDEFILVLSGEVVMVHDGGETTLVAGDCYGFAAGATAHQLINRSEAAATYLEVGDRKPGDQVDYPRDDLVAVQSADGWVFHHKDGSPYPRP
ncbi:MAG: cupin domain-containing protein [Janthinobacterium lividum]